MEITLRGWDAFVYDTKYTGYAGRYKWHEICYLDDLANLSDDEVDLYHQFQAGV